MRLRRAWLEEVRRFAAVIFACLLVGALLDRLGWLLALAVPLYLIVLLADTVRTLSWVELGSGAGPPPKVSGFCAALISIVIDRRQQAQGRDDDASDRISHLRNSIDAVPDAIVALDSHLRISWSNDSAEELLGVRAGSDQGQLIENLIRHPILVRLLHTRQEENATTIPSPIAPDRTLNVRLVTYGDGESVLVARDETETLRVQQMREDFISNVSHELKTPLTVIGGYVETMIDAGHAFDSQWQRPLQSMSSQVQRMTHLVEDLLLLSRIESVTGAQTIEPIDVPAMVTQLVDEARELSAPKQHLITAEVAPDVQLRGSESDIRTAFSNLVANAVHYTPSGGEIDLRWYANGGMAIFEVSDSGDGIDPVHIPRLTERFYRVDPGRSRDAGGTGLGLAIVKHVLLHYGANMVIDSVPGKGSRFACQFPLGEFAQRKVGDQRVTGSV